MMAGAPPREDAVRAADKSTGKPLADSCLLSCVVDNEGVSVTVTTAPVINGVGMVNEYQFAAAVETDAVTAVPLLGNGVGDSGCEAACASRSACWHEQSQMPRARDQCTQSVGAATHGPVGATRSGCVEDIGLLMVEVRVGGEDDERLFSDDE
jgi:hypothetical protein